MSLEKKKKKKNQQQSVGEMLSGKVRSEWVQKRPVLLFVLGFILLLALFYAFWLSSFFELRITPVINGINARIASFILNLLGQGTHPDGFSIASEKFSVSIAMGCDAVEAMALFAIAVITFPGRIVHKVIGVPLGVALLFVLNLVRIVSLYLVGVYYPSAFELMHVEVWQILFIIFAIALWVFWIKRTRNPNSHVSQQNSTDIPA